MNTTKIYKVKGMHCVSCVAKIENTLKKIDGVSEISVNNATEKIKISYDDTEISGQTFNEKLKPLGYFLEMEGNSPQTSSKSDTNTDTHTNTDISVKNKAEIQIDKQTTNQISPAKQEKLQKLAQMKSRVFSMVPLTAITILIMAWEILSKYHILPAMSETMKTFFDHLMPIFATFIFATLGKPYVIGVYRFFRYGKAGMDTLIGLGTVAAFVYSFVISAFAKELAPYLNVQHTFYDSTIVVITFVTLGKYLEAKSRLKTGYAIEKFLGLQSKTAIVVRAGQEIEIPISEVVPGDEIVVKPGQRIPVDGTIISGSSFIDESMLTGEAIPVEKNISEQVAAGSLNTSGTFNFRATKIGSETLLAHIIKMVEDAQGSKAPIQTLADKISAVFVPIVLALATISFAAWLYFGIPIFGLGIALGFALSSFISVLVISCPCALGLATPTAIIVGVGKGAQNGILIKDAATLQKLYKATTIVLDKTGTLTYGKPQLTKIENLSKKSDLEIISILATLESKSEHPIAHAIVSYGKEQNITLKQIEQFEGIKGKGLKGVIDGTQYLAGNTKILVDLNIKFDPKHLEEETMQGKTPIILCDTKSILAIVFVADQIKNETKETILALKKLGKKVMILSGDNKNTSRHIAEQAGITNVATDVIAEILPEDKLRIIKELQTKGEIVAMVGDGINDAPALAQADVGIAMGTGIDIAIDSAGITLLGGDLSKLTKAIKLSEMTMTGIKQNLFFAFIYNIIGIPLAGGLFYPIFGWLLSPVFAGFAMAMSSTSVISNSLRIKAKKL